MYFIGNITIYNRFQGFFFFIKRRENIFVKEIVFKKENGNLFVLLFFSKKSNQEKLF